MPSLFRRGGEYSTPTTVLGFYAGVLVILELGVIGAITVLASNDDLHYLVPWVLGFGGIVLVALLAVVVAMNVRNPSKLQLGKMTAREYIEVQKMTLGDSIAGEYVEEVPKALDQAVIGDSPEELPVGGSAADTTSRPEENAEEEKDDA